MLRGLEGLNDLKIQGNRLHYVNTCFVIFVFFYYDSGEAICGAYLTVENSCVKRAVIEKRG